MKKSFIFILLAIVVGVLIAVMYQAPTSSLPTILVKDKQVSVRIVQTPEEITKGLGGTEKLEENEGMLFIFPSQNIHPSFWMKDMVIDIDIIWIDDGKVVDISHNVPAMPGTPESDLPLYTPSQNIDYVLEVPAGFSNKNNIQIGDSVDLSSITSN